MRGSAVRLLVAGTVAQLVGFGVDARLHDRDPGLAARESVFSLANPGHALVAAGLALALTGAIVLAIGPRLERGGRRQSVIVGIGVVTAAVLATGSAAVAVESSRGTPRDRST